MAKVTYTVKKGDTLTSIAKKYNTTVKKLVELNDITDPDFIVVGQVLVISDDSGSTTKKTNKSNKAVIKAFGLQSDTDRTVYATWTWDKSNTDHYAIRWYYYTGDGVAFEGNSSDVTVKQSTYNAPSNATGVKFKVKPVSKKKKVNGKETSYWTAEWSTEQKYYFSNNPPGVPPVPTVTIKDLWLTAEVSGLGELNAKEIIFQIYKSKDDGTFKKYEECEAIISAGSATATCDVEAGREYKVRCRGQRGDELSDWSEFSTAVASSAKAPKITECVAKDKTTVSLTWSAVATADSYEVQYTTEKDYFDRSSGVSSLNVTETSAYVTGLTSGETWWFRVRSLRDNAEESGWSNIVSAVIGTKPTAPTTWSSTTTAKVGEDVTLYWVHNSEDGSKETLAELEITTNGSTKTHTIESKNTEDDDEVKTSTYKVSTSATSSGAKILWRVRTAGITKEYGEWSVQRTIDIYAPPTLGLRVTNVNGTDLSTITSFPFYVEGDPGPDSQTPLSYHLSVIANSSYETTDQMGNTQYISSGQEVYSKYFDTNKELVVEFTPSNIDLENNVSYTVKGIVAMDSGLTAEATDNFSVRWADVEYSPNAEIHINRDNLTASIRPYCEDGYGARVNDVSLSVYRREYNGEFVEIGKGLSNSKNTFVTDPHPALDFARYRIVAVDNSTGAISYYDLPGELVDESSVVIQWDEEWSNFETSSEDSMEEPTWAGSMLKLPYNIDVSESNSPDVSLIKYIGRSHPVSYYGTHVNTSATWNVEIDATDKETLYALRRLQNYMGDVYVREPSGSGYWANINVSFNQKHLAVTIPVTLDVVRVEGGI